MPADGGRAAAKWSLRLGPVALRLDNFQWRRCALPMHDAHHLATGYRCSPLGEFEMAAWEFAAGRYPSICATLFCLPLVAMGTLIIPRRSFAAYARGRRSRTLYAIESSVDWRSLSLAELRALLLPSEDERRSLRDLAGYAALAAISLAMMAAPLALLLLAHG